MEKDPCACVTGVELQVRFAYFDALLRRYRELEPGRDLSYYKYRENKQRVFTSDGVRELYKQFERRGGFR